MVIHKDGGPLVNSADPVSWSSSGRGSTRVAVAIILPVIAGDELQMYPLRLAVVPISKGAFGILLSSFMLMCLRCPGRIRGFRYATRHADAADSRGKKRGRQLPARMFEMGRA